MDIRVSVERGPAGEAAHGCAAVNERVRIREVTVDQRLTAGEPGPQKPDFPQQVQEPDLVLPGQSLELPLREAAALAVEIAPLLISYMARP
ncbi:hypothetical protein ACWEG1_24750 [Streptomyces bauhiniae]